MTMTQISLLVITKWVRIYHRYYTGLNFMALKDIKRFSTEIILNGVGSKVRMRKTLRCKLEGV